MFQNLPQNVKKKKKSAQNFFILKYVIKSFKTSKILYIKVLVELKVLIFIFL